MWTAGRAARKRKRGQVVSGRGTAARKRKIMRVGRAWVEEGAQERDVGGAGCRQGTLTDREDGIHGRQGCSKTKIRMKASEGRLGQVGMGDGRGGGKGTKCRIPCSVSTMGWVGPKRPQNFSGGTNCRC